MDGINVEALLSTLMPMNFTPQSGGAQAATGTDSLFLNLLQSFAESTGGEAAAEVAQTGASPGNWLATLFGLLAPSGAPNNLLPTPDSSGEASDGTDETVSLTNMMAAIQALAGENAGGTLTAEQMMEAIAQSAEDTLLATDGSLPLSTNDTATKKSLDVMVAELGLAQNPAMLAALAQLQQQTQTAVEAGGNVAATGTQHTDPSPLAAVMAQLTGESKAPKTTAQPTQTDTAPANTVATEAKPASVAPAVSTAAKPAAEPAVMFDKALNTAQAQNAQTSPTTQNTQPSPAASTVPAAEMSSTHTEPASGEKAMVLPAGAPPLTAPQTSSAPAVSAPAAPAVPQHPALPNIPALHQLADTISVLKQNGQTAVRLHLHPESLGQVLVQMHVHNGDITVQLLTETGKAQSLIQNHLPELKAAFSAQGLTTGGLDVSVGSDASAFAAPQRQNFNWQTDSRKPAPATTVDGVSDMDTAPKTRLNRRLSGRIDYQI